MPSEVIDAWPLCPQCGAARVAECQVCHAAKDFFPAADQQPGHEHELRFCISCDDVAELRFYRLCHACGQDFGDGLTPRSPEPQEHEDLSRIRWVLLTLLGLMAAVAGYFYWLLR